MNMLIRRVHLIATILLKPKIRKAILYTAATAKFPSNEENKDSSTFNEKNALVVDMFKVPSSSKKSLCTFGTKNQYKIVKKIRIINKNIQVLLSTFFSDFKIYFKLKSMVTMNIIKKMVLGEIL